MNESTHPDATAPDEAVVPGPALADLPAADPADVAEVPDAVVAEVPDAVVPEVPDAVVAEVPDADVPAEPSVSHPPVDPDVRAPAGSAQSTEPAATEIPAAPNDSDLRDEAAVTDVAVLPDSPVILLPPAQPAAPMIPEAAAAEIPTAPAVPKPTVLAGPRPVPRPGPPPAPRPSSAVPAAAVIAPPIVSSAGAVAAAAFGRVADDGTVFVLLPDGGEQQVGQWAAGDPAEGLAFFARKYDDVAVEVDLATRRLRDGKATPDQAAAVVKRATEALAMPSMVGDLASLAGRITELETLIENNRAVAAAEKAAVKARVLADREAIAVEAESLAESTQWKSTGERFKTLLDQWKSTPRADRGPEQQMWKRFSHARSVFDKRRRQYFAKLDSERSEASQVKESIATEAEALSTSTEWGPTAAAYRDLMTRWKVAGRAGKAEEEQLWQRFRVAQDAFFAARNATFETRDVGQSGALQAKLALLTEAEAINTSDARGAKSALRSVLDRWEAIGHVPRGDKERIEARLRKVEESIRKGDADQWRRTNPEALARAEDTIAQFRGSLTKLEAERDKATAAGDAKKAADVQSRITTTKALLAAAERAAVDFGG
jgi:hypothetical protein